MELNELNKNAMGGTELMEQRIRKHVDFGEVQLICSRVRELDENKQKILWLHDLAEDPEVSHLANGGWQNFDKLIFVSHWQQSMYNKILNVPYNAGFVIPNCIEPAPEHTKPTDKIRLIYFSTPHRGLNIAYSVFNELYKKYGDQIELNVFSSFDLYGWGERDEQFKPLFDLCEEHPAINYSKSISNDAIRKELERSHILAYPSIWAETSCLTLIESMAYGLTCIHSSLGALPETSMGLTTMYNYLEDPNVHSGNFYAYMDKKIEMHLEGSAEVQSVNTLVSGITNMKHDVKNIAPVWNRLLDQMNNA